MRKPQRLTAALTTRARKTAARTLALLPALLFVALHAHAAHIVVAPNGSDNGGNGTVARPYATLKKAQQMLKPGTVDTVLLRGGRYAIRPQDAMGCHERNYLAVIRLYRSGSPLHPVCYMAYPGDDRPVLDFSAVKPRDLRVSAVYLDASYLHLKGFDIVGVQVTQHGHTQSEGISLHTDCHDNVVEDVRIHDGMAIGVYIKRGHDNTILNCDAYNNYDPVSEDHRGGNTDGFGCHVKSPVDTGNRFVGCRAWRNSDDGFDCINCFAPVVFDHCWAWQNGYDAGMQRRADGNGFKAGGYNRRVMPAWFKAPTDTVRQCIAFDNKANGFYANHHLTGNVWIGNTACANGAYNYNMVCQRANNSTDDVDGYGHTLIDNTSYRARREHIGNVDTARCLLRGNSFQPGVAPRQDDHMESLDSSRLAAPRKADGSLPGLHTPAAKPKQQDRIPVVGHRHGGPRQIHNGSKWVKRHMKDNTRALPDP